MKTIALLLLVAGLCRASTSGDPMLLSPQSQFPCSGYESKTGSFFSFHHLMSKSDYRSRVTVSNFNGETFEGQAVFNVCAELQADPDCKNQTLAGAVGYLKITGVVSKQTVCVGMSNLMQLDREGYTRWHLKGFFGQQGEPFTWTVTSENTNSTVPFATQFVFSCGSNTGLNNIKVAVDSKFKTIVIKGDSSSACPVSSGKITSFLKTSKILAILLIVLGALLLFSGLASFKYISTTVGFIVGFVFTLVCAISMKNPYSWTILSYCLVFFLALIMGILVAFIGYYFTDLVMIVAGGVVGYMLGLAMISAFSASLGYGTEASVAEVMILCLGVAAGIMAGYFFHDYLLILITSFGGAFLFALGLTSLLYRFPELRYLDQAGRLDAGVRHELSREFLAACGLVIVLGAVGAFVQLKRLRAKDPGAPRPADPPGHAH